MKKLLIGFVMAAISAFTFVGTANAAEPKATYVNVLGGYQFDTDNGLKHQELSQGVTQKEHGFVQAAVGVPVSGVNLQLEYAQNKADYSNGVAGKQETTSLVAASFLAAAFFAPLGAFSQSSLATRPRSDSIVA